MSSPAGPVGLRRVLEQEQLVAVGERSEALQVDRLPVEVHRKQRGGSRRDRRLDGIGLQ